MQLKEKTIVLMFFFMMDFKNTKLPRPANRGGHGESKHVRYCQIVALAREHVFRPQQKTKKPAFMWAFERFSPSHISKCRTPDYFRSVFAAKTLRIDRIG
jgi:hypothetical protein